MNNKPKYEIENAWVAGGCLWGSIKDHPNCTNGGTHATSKIVSQTGDTVETRNSIYTVKSWAKV